MRVHARASLAIGLAHLPPARVEPGSRHRGHRLPIPREQVPDRLALAVMGILGDPVAPGEHEPPPAAHATRRSATAPSRCGAGTRPRSPAPPFSLPAPGSRTPDLDPVMRDEPLEHLHHHDPVPRDPPRRAGGVVRAPAPAAPRRCARTPRAAPRRTHSAFSPGNATAYRMFEYGNDATRQCTSVRLPATTACAKPKSACITPGDHSNPRIPVTGKPMLLPPALHVPLHDPARTIEPLLLDQPVIHAPGRMPPLYAA